MDALIDAIRAGRVARVRDLIASGADINAPRGALTPVLEAVQYQRADVVDALVAAGADCRVGTPDCCTPIELACAIAAPPEVAKALLRGGADPNQRAWDDVRTPVLILALASGDVETAAALVEAGADVNACTDLGVPPLCYAVGRPHMLLSLVTHGARINFATTAGHGALHYAAVAPSNAGASVRLLAELGADVDQRGRGGVTPLHRAVRKGDVGSVLALIACGACPLVKDEAGHTALDVATGPTRAVLLDLWRTRKIP